MGFSDSDIRLAITECGYNTEACADWIVNRKQDKKPRLFVGMEVWIFSPDDNDWCPGNVVSITKQLISIIFNGHDFRWLEKESDLYKIQDHKPAARNPTNTQYPYNNTNDEDEVIDDPYSGDMQQEYTPPRQDETDYYVTFTESVLGLELYSDEDGFNCIVGRCVSTIARSKVTPGSQIVQVNDRWLANYRFEEIRDAVKQAARQPPLAVTFRIKKNLLRRKNQNNQQNITIPQQQQQQNVPNTAHLFSAQSPYGNNGTYDVSQSATSPEMEQNGDSKGLDVGGDDNKLMAPKSNAANGGSAHNASLDEEKRSQPNDIDGSDTDFMGTLGFDECDKLQIGDHIDHRDDVGRFLLATIVDSDEYKVKIHYEGWNSKWDTWCDYKNETHRFAAPRSISRKPNTRFRDLKIRDYVDINPIQRHRGWRVGQIRRMDKYSGQAQIVYKEDGQEFLYWAHLNNPEEIAPFMTRAAETIALQQKIAEFEEEQQTNDHKKNGKLKNKSDDDSGASPDEVNINGNNNGYDGGQKNGQKFQSFNNSNVQNVQQQQLLNSFMSPPAATATTATDQSVGYNSNIGYNQNQGMNVNGFGNNNGPQPPPANMNMGGGDKYNGGYNNGINITSHQKSKSRVLPRTIKNKKLPPKPAKNMIKKRNKGINRSRTQPLPDNQNGGGKNNMNMNGNGMNMNGMNMNNGMNNGGMIGNGMNMMPMNMNNGQMMNGGMNNKPIQNTTNFADLNFNAGQQFQSQQHPQSTNFMHGKTTYTSQW